MRLRSRLQRARIDVDEVNIWEDPAGAAFVRSVAGRNETVPMARIGDRRPRPLCTQLGHRRHHQVEAIPAVPGMAEAERGPGGMVARETEFPHHDDPSNVA